MLSSLFLLYYESINFFMTGFNLNLNFYEQDFSFFLFFWVIMLNLYLKWLNFEKKNFKNQFDAVLMFKILIWIIYFQFESE